MYNEIMENTDFVIEHIDKEVKVITDRPSSVVNYPANTDFFIENIDDNVISIAHSLNIEASEVEFRPANTDFFIENIDNNVIMIAESLELIPSEVTIRPANTDFFVENIDKNLIAIAEYYELEPSRVVFRPANTDMFIENIDRNVTLIKSRTNVITKSGSFINVDVPDGGTMQLTAIDGNATQTTYSGKNLIDGTSPTDANFATTSLNNNITTVSSTVTSTIPYARWVIEGLSPNDVIRYSSVIMDSNGQIYLQYDNNGTWTTISSSGSQYTDGTTPATYSWTNTVNTAKVRFLLYANKTVPSGAASSRYKNTILTVNNSDLSYEPYVGGIPAPNPQFPMPISTVTGEQTVSVVGKNLLDFDGFLTTDGATYTENRGIYSVTEMGSMYARPYPLKLQAGKTYTMNQTYLTQASTNVRLDILKNGSVYVSCYADQPENRVRTFVAGDATYSIRANYSSRVYPVLFSCPMLAEANAETAYEPYQAQEFPIDLGSLELAKVPGTNYRDRIYEDGGKWYVEKQVGKVVLDSNANINVYNTQNSIISFRAFTDETIISSPNTIPTDGLLSDHCQVSSFSDFYNAQTRAYGTICVASSKIANFYITAPNSTVTTETQFKTWLTSHPTTVYYALATPTTTEITDETLLEQLNFVADMYEGINNISFIGTGAQGTIEVVINKD